MTKNNLIKYNNVSIYSQIIIKLELMILQATCLKSTGPSGKTLQRAVYTVQRLTTHVFQMRPLSLSCIITRHSHRAMYWCFLIIIYSN